MTREELMSEIWRLRVEAAKIRAMLTSGVGRTNKPLPPKRVSMLRQRLEEVERKLTELELMGG